MEEERSAEEINSLEGMNAHLVRMSEYAELQTEFLSTISKQLQQQSKMTRARFASGLVQFQQQGLLAMVSGYLAALGIGVVLLVWTLNQLSGWGQVVAAILLFGWTVFMLHRIFELYERVMGIVSHANQIVEELLSKELTEDELEELREGMKGDAVSKKNWLRRVLGR